MPTNSTSRHEVTEAYSTTEYQSCLAADAEGLKDAVLGTWIPGEVWLFPLWFSEMGKTLDRISYKTNYSFPLICILRMCFKICIPSCAKVWKAVWCFSPTWTYKNQEGHGRCFYPERQPRALRNQHPQPLPQMPALPSLITAVTQGASKGPVNRESNQ